MDPARSQTFILRVRDAGGALDGDVYIRLRRALKYLWRTAALKCTSIEEVKDDTITEPDVPSAHHAKS
jgi:hypothetical protein